MHLFRSFILCRCLDPLFRCFFVLDALCVIHLQSWRGLSIYNYKQLSPRTDHRMGQGSYSIPQAKGPMAAWHQGICQLKSKIEIDQWTALKCVPALKVPSEHFIAASSSHSYFSYMQCYFLSFRVNREIVVTSSLWLSLIQYRYKI